MGKALKRVFRLFREKGGLLRALDLWGWYEELDVIRQREVKKYYSLKVVKDLSFPYRAEHFDSGEVKTSYTKRTFIATLAQTALLEGDFEVAEWLYTEALKLEGSPYEAHLILNDLTLLARSLGDRSKMKLYCEEDLRLFPEYREELMKRHGGKLPRINSFELYLHLLEREGRQKDALSLLEFMRKEGIEFPHYEEVKDRLLSL